MQPPERPLITVPEAARMCGVSTRTAATMYLSGQWPSIKIGSRRLIVLQDLQRWIDERKAATP
jgi:excisionase family DNA binding protein